jgi:hypothetical protein
MDASPLLQPNSETWGGYGGCQKYAQNFGRETSERATSLKTGKEIGRSEAMRI